MKHRVYYLTLQLSLILAPAICATITLNINNYITNPFTELLIYTVGVLALFPLGFLSEHLKDIISESYASILSIGIYLCVATFILNKLYQPIKKRIFLVRVVNSLLALWSVFVGAAFMFVAMQ